MWELGRFALRLGLCLSAYAILADLLGVWRNRQELLRSGRNSTIGTLLCLTVSAVALWVLLVRGDFAVSYVAEHSSRDLPLVYKLTALWAGASGSLLLWLWLQVGFVVLAFAVWARRRDRFCANARAATNLVAVFFFVVLIFDKDPFALSTVTPSDGAGLNPLLQHPAMALHPPTLFVGYAAFSIPFAWTLASLRRKDLSESELFFPAARNWSLLAWTFLTVGIALGAWWAYEELGWGGYWAWDPVENSSLMPWLTATALLHCARMYRAQTKIAVWFMILALGTFTLCIFGTFLTRYGLVSSVHAFPDPGLGILFFILVILLWVLAGVLSLNRLRQGAVLTPLRGRGFTFLIVNNWLLVLLAFVIFVGTLFPFFSRYFSDEPISLKSDYFTKITAPFGLALLLLIGVCPYLLRRGLVKSWRTLGAGAVAVAAAAIWWLAHSLALACLVICAFVGANLVADVVLRFQQRRPDARWLGARIVHLGVLLAFIGIAGSGGYDIEKDIALRQGQEVTVGSFGLRFDGLTTERGPNFTATSAKISVFKGQTKIDGLSPSRAFYESSRRETSEVDVRRTWAGDLYLALTQVDRGGRLINLTVHVKPLINWIWIGTILMVVGTALVIFAVLRKRPATAPIEELEA
ncbi:MAG: heme lyase CcmF/NrfE family subunit [Sedimentisphaerales bacterium]|nr:heme lyase CcmF/NrfE family subunit [Sedimentisphaerales bacterium]